jgi:D-threo-aldose 1-dehydrogenase
LIIGTSQELQPVNPFETVPVGPYNLPVMRLGLGGAPLSGMVLADGLYGGSAHDEAVRIIRRAYQLGIRYFDTAPLYGNGRSEARFRDGLSGVPRDSYVLSTKVGRVLDPGPGDPSTDNPDMLPDLIPVNSWTRSDVHRSIEESLERLQMDRIDIVYVHDPDQEAFGEQQATDEAFPALIELREQGTIRAIGCGMNTWEMPARFVKRFDLDIVLLAGRYTLLDHSGLAEFLPLCLERGTKIAIGGPYNSGILARDLSGPVSFNYEPAPQELVDRARRLKAVCEHHGVDLKAAALQFVLAHPAVATVIPGAQTVGELQQNARLVEKHIPARLWSQMRADGLIPADAPTPA